MGGGAYRNSNHIYIYISSLTGPRPPMRGRIETQTISSLIGPRSPIRRRIEAQAISSLIGPRPLMWGRIESQTISSLSGGGGGGYVSNLKPYPPDRGPVPEKSVYRGSGNVIFFWNRIFPDWAPVADTEASRSSSHILFDWAPTPDGGGRIEPQTISFLIGGGGRGGGYRSSNHIVWAPLPDKDAYRSSSHIGPRLPMRWRVEAQTISSLIGAGPDGGGSTNNPYRP